MQSDSPSIKVYFVDEFQRSDIGRKVKGAGFQDGWFQAIIVG